MAHLLPRPTMRSGRFNRKTVLIRAALSDPRRSRLSTRAGVPCPLPPLNLYRNRQTLFDSKYQSLGGSTSFLGPPISPVFSLNNGGIGRQYQGGSIYWSSATGAREVPGAIRDLWGSTGWENGHLGMPISDETTGYNGQVRVSHSTGGDIYWTAASPGPAPTRVGPTASTCCGWCRSPGPSFHLPPRCCATAAGPCRRLSAGRCGPGRLVTEPGQLAGVHVHALSPQDAPAR